VGGLRPPTFYHLNFEPTMNKNILIVAFAFILTACNLNKDPNVFDSDKLIGKYKVDLTPFIAEAVKSEKGDNEWEKVGKGIAGLALSSVEIELNFYENQKGIMHLDGGLIDFANAFSDEPIEKINEFSYKVEKDSILYMKGIKDKEYKQWAIVRKFSENYDYLQFLIIEEGKDKVFFNLKKIQDKN
jgi:hypothetical protein